jgi:hypothetical protein
MTEDSTVEAPQGKPSLRSRLLILLIGGGALAGIVLMCIVVFAIIAFRS